MTGPTEDDARPAAAPPEAAVTPPEAAAAAEPRPARRAPSARTAAPRSTTARASTGRTSKAGAGAEAGASEPGAAAPKPRTAKPRSTTGAARTTKPRTPAEGATTRIPAKRPVRAAAAQQASGTVRAPKGAAAPDQATAPEQTVAAAPAAQDEPTRTETLEAPAAAEPEAPTAAGDDTTELHPPQRAGADRTTDLLPAARPDADRTLLLPAVQPAPEVPAERAAPAATPPVRQPPTAEQAPATAKPAVAERPITQRPTTTEQPVAARPEAPQPAPDTRPPVAERFRSQPVLQIRGLTKRFGDTTAVDRIDLVVQPGSFYGIVGPNGAGKTTTLSMVTGLLRPDAGSVQVHGIDVWREPERAKRAIGVLPDALRLFDRLSGAQLLHYSGVLRGLDAATVKRRTADLVAAFGLEDATGRLVADYSAGMTKKIALACSMIHSPRLLVLDEPFESVDPVSAANIVEILQHYVAAGGTVVLSSHGMDFIQRVCDHVAIIIAGKVLAAGTTDEVRGEQTLEERFVQLAGGRKAAEGLEWLHSFSD